MRKQLALLAFISLGVSLSSFADQKPMSATIISQTSVDCGTKNQGKGGKKGSTNILCQQYTVHTADTEYQIRQQKPGDMAIIPPNTPIDFTLDKDKMKFKANGKKYEFLVVGTSALPPNGVAPH
jgi:hypothetical protein